MYLFLFAKKENNVIIYVSDFIGGLVIKNSGLSQKWLIYEGKEADGFSIVNKCVEGSSSV